MRDLYATALRLVHVGGGSAFEVARSRALDWAWRVENEPPDIAERPDGQVVEGEGDGRTEVSWSSVDSKAARSVEVRLSHPDGDDPSMRWHAAIAISEVQGATRVTVRLGVGATVYELRPSPISLRAPSVVREMMQSPLLAYAGSTELEPGVSILDEEDAAELLKKLKADRALPIIVLSSAVEMSFAESLMRGLAGMAQIVRVRDAAGDDILRTVLSSSGFTVPRAGLRLFWPGFGSPDQPRRHPYWTAAQLRLGARSKHRSVLDQVVGMLAPVATARVPADPGLLRARQEWLQERLTQQQAREDANRERARRQRENAKKATQEARRLASGDKARHLQDRLAEVEALLDLAERERAESDGRAKAAEEAELKAVEEAVEHSEQNEVLSDENTALRRNLETMSRFDALAEEGDEDDPIPDALESWSAVADHLEDLEGPGFCLTDAARACANGKGRYPRPDLMWKSLRALERVGRAYNEMGAELGMRFERFAMEKAGLDVALQDSSYEGHLFEYDGASHSRLPHVKIDDAKPANEVGRIYFAIDNEGKRVIVDWFGAKPDRPEAKRVATTSA